MGSTAQYPSDILDAITLIRQMSKKAYLSRSEREEINRAKLRIAFWSCRKENIAPSRENLSYILGPDAPEIMDSYDKYLEKDKQTVAKGKTITRRKASGEDKAFWDDT
ncbi:MAG: hypothetical protein FWG74_04170 [Planctomycetes bacterium]|nr:hypothetical protein [Planctomycetota bacterium]